MACCSIKAQSRRSRKSPIAKSPRAATRLWRVAEALGLVAEVDGVFAGRKKYAEKQVVCVGPCGGTTIHDGGPARVQRLRKLRRGHADPGAGSQDARSCLSAIERIRQSNRRVDGNQGQMIGCDSSAVHAKPGSTAAR